MVRGPPVRGQCSSRKNNMCSTDRRREETTGFKLTYETTHLVWLRIEEIWGRVAIFKSLDIIRFAF